jgi:23S rRNA (uracil1939-C5)-methyltransferase
VEAQLRVKQEALAENLKRIGGVAPTEWLAPLHAGAWGYRGKARLGVRYVRGKGRVLVGFREKGSSLITDTERCEVLVPSVGEKIQALCRLIDGLSIREQVPQIEVAAGDRTTCLVFRTLTPPEAADRERLCDFGTEHGFSIYIQPGGPDTVQPLVADSEPLFYDLPQWRLRLYFQPQDFTQVNMAVNRRMLDRALDLLDVRAGDRVLDLFCGLGNFSLPLARAGARVTGVEGDAAMVERARRNAELNGIEGTSFHAADLFESPSEAAWWPPAVDKVVLDPPRSGAEAAVQRLPRLGAEKILYVSCNPATLARDAAVLVREGGYRLAKAGVVDMFPHTAHSEAMALFTGPGR